MAKYKEVLTDATSCTLGNTPNRSTQCKLCSAQVVVSKFKRFIEETLGIPETTTVSSYSVDVGGEVTMTVECDLPVTKEQVVGLAIRSFTLTDVQVSEKIVTAKFTADPLDAHKDKEKGVVGLRINGVQRLAQVEVKRPYGVTDLKAEKSVIAVGEETNLTFNIVQQ